MDPSSASSPAGNGSSAVATPEKTKAVQALKAVRERVGGKKTPKKTDGKAGKRQKLDAGQKKAMDWVEDWFLDNPDQILTVKSNIESGEIGSARKQNAKKAEQDVFPPETYKYFRQLPKYLLSVALVKFASFLQEECDLIDFHDREAIRFLIAFFFGLMASTGIPSQLEGKRENILTFCKVRAESEPYKSRIAAYRSKGFLTDEYKIDWWKFGVFSFDWSSGDNPVVEAITMNSIRSRKVDISSYNLTKDWDFGGNHNEKVAHFKKRKQELSCINFFDDEDGWDYDKAFKEALSQHVDVALTRIASQAAVTAGVETATSATVFTLAKQQADEARKVALAKRVRTPSKGLCVPLLLTMPAVVPKAPQEEKKE